MLAPALVSFLEQPDLAQRCLTLRLQSMPESKRRSETAMWADLERDLPAIQRGLFELIAQILAKLPEAGLSPRDAFRALQVPVDERLIQLLDDCHFNSFFVGSALMPSSPRRRRSRG